jgi:ethanolamine utilization microcompartment shell protein EutS
VLLGSNNWYQSKVHLGFIAVARGALVVAGGATVSVFKSLTSRRLVVQELMGFRLESPTRLSGQVDRISEG